MFCQGMRYFEKSVILDIFYEEKFLLTWKRLQRPVELISYMCNQIMAENEMLQLSENQLICTAWEEERERRYL